jgi:pimeloyl-ACP methyl ester carboxylesterase
MRRILSWSTSLAVAAAVSIALVPGAGADDDDDREGRSPRGVGTVVWGPCSDETLAGFGAECGTLSVPLDYRRPRGEHIEIALSRVQHTVPDEDYQGIMLVNPGGPGGSGLIYAIFGALLPPGVGDAYDWIGFDPRGVGSSVPALSCIPDYFVGPRPPYDPVTPALEEVWLDRAEEYAEACEETGDDLLEHLRTTDNARDMDAIRWSLGERKLNFYGFSYGTYLGQVYATLFPHRVGRMVFDANVDPTRVWYRANLDQDYAFETVIQFFFDWIAKYDDVYDLGATNDEVEATFYAARDSLRGTTGTVGPAEFVDAFLLPGYVQALWPDLAAALADYVHRGDLSGIAGWYEAIDGPGDDNGYAMYLGTECTDAPWPRRWSTWRRDNTLVAQDAPFFTWGNAWFNAPCAFWDERAGRPVKVRDRGLPPILLVSEEFDAATPFSGSLEVRDRLKESVLIEVAGGTTHANSLAGNECVDGPIFDYLAFGALPPRQPGSGPDVVCAALPEPVPAEATAPSAATGGSARTTAKGALLQLHFGVVVANRG